MEPRHELKQFDSMVLVTTLYSTYTLTEMAVLHHLESA